MGICESKKSKTQNNPLSESKIIDNVQQGKPCVSVEKINKFH